MWENGENSFWLLRGVMLSVRARMAGKCSEFLRKFMRKKLYVFSLKTANVDVDRRWKIDTEEGETSTEKKRENFRLLLAKMSCVTSKWAAKKERKLEFRLVSIHFSGCLSSIARLLERWVNEGTGSRCRQRDSRRLDSLKPFFRMSESSK